MNEIERIRNLVREQRYSLKQHAHQRMTERDVFTDDLEGVILGGEVVEQNPQNYPCPTWIFMRFLRGQPLYIVCALSSEWVYIITVHWYDPKKWADPWTRKKSPYARNMP